MGSHYMITRVWHSRFIGCCFTEYYDGAAAAAGCVVVNEVQPITDACIPGGRIMLSQHRIHNPQAGRGVVPGAGISTERRSGRWECALSERFIGEYLIVPLTTARMLSSEGYLMNNCCQEYRHTCETQKYCLFSIRSRSGERRATLGLAREQGGWRFDQCLGPSNAEVLEESLNYLDEEEVLQTEFFPTEMYYIAHEVVRLMNRTGSSH